MLDSDLPEDRQPDAGEIEPTESDDSIRSLADDVEALIDDGKTYVEAEVAFQKSRLSFAANRGKSGAILVLGALAFIHLALIGLVVGGTISLMPYLGPFGATAAVAGGLLVAAALLLFMAKGRFAKLSAAFKKTGDE